MEKNTDEMVEDFEKRNTVEVVSLGEDPRWLKEMKNKPSESTDLIILTSLEKGYSVEEIEKLMVLSERHQKNIAKQAYFEDFARFKAEAPPVKKDKYNKFFDSWYTSLGVLLATYNPVLGQHGLSLSFPSPEQTDNSMTVECRISHRMGHSESYKMKGPIDKAAVGKASGQKSRNDMQDLKSTFTYLRSATCEGALGIAGTEAGAFDDDGNKDVAEFISKEQLATLIDKMEKTSMTEKLFLRSLKVNTLSELPSSKFDFAMGILKARMGK